MFLTGQSNEINTLPEGIFAHTDTTVTLGWKTTTMSSLQREAQHEVYVFKIWGHICSAFPKSMIIRNAWYEVAMSSTRHLSMTAVSFGAESLPQANSG